jgi:hypothetical protein
MASRFSPRVFIPLVAAFAACTIDSAGTDTTDPLGGKTPMEVCLEYCPLCTPPGEDCEKDCIAAFRDATPVCERLLAAQYACYRDAILQDGCDVSPPCGPELGAASDCAWHHGCLPSALGNNLCEPDPADSTCYCRKSCKPTDPPLQYRVDCTPNATATETHCDCFYNDALVGSCQQTELSCDVWTSCCNQYFPALQ